MPGSANFSECMKWATTTQSSYDIDRNQCLTQSKITYPDSLYDYGRTIRTRSFDRYGRPYYYDDYLSGDSYRNAELDRLRSGIAKPCMVEKGWHDPNNWQSGRKK